MKLSKEQMLELREIFREEAMNHVKAIGKVFVQLTEGGTEDAVEPLGRAYREAHGLKGSAGTIGITRIARLGEKLEDVCYSLQETTFSMMTEVAERALAHTGKNEVILTGGVAANKRLQKMLDTMCSERGGSFAAVPMEYSGDNAAMIAWTGILAHQSGTKPINNKTAEILPRWRTDQVEISWL